MNFLFIRWLMLCLMLAILSACAPDPMEVCMKETMDRKLPADGVGRAKYIKLRDQVPIHPS